MENPDKFCSACGSGLIATAVICPSCGSPVAGYKPNNKKKYVAVLLAVFLGYWSWLYTAKKNLPKFFIALGLSIIAGIVIALNQTALSNWADLWTACFISNIQGGTDFDCNQMYPSNSSWGTYIQAGWLVVGGLYLWALIDNIRRPSDYFINFPNHG